MYPDPHIPSAPIERAVSDDCRPSEVSRQTLLLIGSSIALFLLASVSLSISVLQQANLQAECDEAASLEESIAVGDHSDHLAEPRFSTRTHPTRMP